MESNQKKLIYPLAIHIRIWYNIHREVEKDSASDNKDKRKDKTMEPNNDYYRMLGCFMMKVYDNPYGRQLGVNAYHTTSLDEVKVNYWGNSPLEDVAAEVAKVVAPFGFTATPAEGEAYNIKIVAASRAA